MKTKNRSIFLAIALVVICLNTFNSFQDIFGKNGAIEISASEAIASAKINTLVPVSMSDQLFYFSDPNTGIYSKVVSFDKNEEGTLSSYFSSQMPLPIPLLVFLCFIFIAIFASPFYGKIKE
jgi:hypothetical protein